MARVNIEEDAYARVSKLSALMRCSQREAIGTIAFLWHDSQDILRVSGTREEIIDWARLYDLSEEEVDRWILALEKSRFISRQPDGSYLIHGNELQIENRVARIHRASKGAEATKRKWAGRLEAGLKPSPSVPQAGFEQTCTRPMQCNANQTNAMQVKEEEAPNASEPPEPPVAGVTPAVSRQREPTGAIPEFSASPVVKEFLERAEIRVRTQSLWLQTYEDPGWISQELLKMLAWLENNPQRRPKTQRGYSTFMSTWLSRGWEYRRRAGPASPPEKKSFLEFMKEQGEEGL